MKRLFVILFAIILFAFPAFGCNSSEKKEEFVSKSVTLAYDGNAVSFAGNEDVPVFVSIDLTDLTIHTDRGFFSSYGGYKLDDDQKAEFLSLLFSEAPCEYTLTTVPLDELDSLEFSFPGCVRMRNSDNSGFDFMLGKHSGKLGFSDFQLVSEGHDYYCMDFDVSIINEMIDRGLIPSR